MTAKMTKTQKAARANEYRVMLAAQMGAVASGNQYALTEFYRIVDGIMTKLGLYMDSKPGMFEFVLLVEKATDHGYRPTLRGDLDPLYTVLADAYDFEQARRGLSFRAYRGQ